VRSPLLGECADAGDVAPNDQRLDGLGALERVDRLEVDHVLDHLVVEQDSVASQQVPRLGKHSSGSGRVVELAKPGEGVAEPALLGEPGHLQAVQPLVRPVVPLAIKSAGTWKAGLLRYTDGSPKTITALRISVPGMSRGQWRLAIA